MPSSQEQRQRSMIRSSTFRFNSKMTMMMALCLFLSSCTSRSSTHTAMALMTPSLSIRHSGCITMAGSDTLERTTRTAEADTYTDTDVVKENKKESLVERYNRKHSQQQRKQAQNAPPHYDLWEVKVYNDNVNTHEWVARCLVLIAATTEWKAYQTTKLAHQQGEASLGIFAQEMAESYTEGLREQGIVVDMFPLQDFQ